jgi:L-threonylcarbamoyladenylate synthase
VALQTRVLTVDPVAGHRTRPAIEEAVGVLRAGGLVAFPTETVYGLGADATNARAVARIFEAKGRPSTNPVIVHGDDIKAVRQVVSGWPRAAAVLAQRFWPGPLTLVLPRSPLVPDAVTAGLGTVGIRIPDCPVALQLLRSFGGPVAAPSANRSTGVSPTTARHVLDDLDGRIDLVLDAGPTRVGIESTVLDLTVDPPRVLRPGAITAGQIGHVLRVAVATAPAAPGDVDTPQTSPGQMDVHYAPRAAVLVRQPDDEFSKPWQSLIDTGFSFADLETISVIKTGLIVAGHRIAIKPGDYDKQVEWTDPVVAARELYATLRRWDDESVLMIEVVLPPDDDDWRAVRDRLWRASRRWSREGQGG